MDCNKINQGNLGVATCSYTPKLFWKAAFSPKGETLTLAQVTAIKTTLDAKLALNDPSKRWHVLGSFEGAEAKNVEATTNTTAYGQIKKVNDGFYGFAFDLTNGGLDMYKNMHSLLHDAQDKFDIWLLDKDNNVIFGMKKGNEYKGFSINYMNVPNWKIPTGTGDAFKFMIDIQLEDPTEINERGAIITMADGDYVMDFESLKQLKVEQVGTVTAGLVKVALKIGETNIFPTFPTLTASLFTAKNNITNGVITVSSVTPDTVSQSYNVQLLITDPDYPAVGSKALITVGDVTALIAANVKGISEGSGVVTI